MRRVSLEYSLADHELEEVLEKALTGLRLKMEQAREFDDPFMQKLAARAKKIVEEQMSQMAVV